MDNKRFNRDGIDESEVLKPGIVEAYLRPRHARGEIEFHHAEIAQGTVTEFGKQMQVMAYENGIIPVAITIGESKDPSILHYLIRIGMADDGYASTAMTYIDWQAAHRAMNNIKTTKYETGDGGEALADLEGNYSKLVSMVPLYHIRKAEEAFKLYPVRPELHQLYYNIRSGYLKAIVEISKAISAIRELNKKNEEEETDCIRGGIVEQLKTVPLQLRPKSEQPA